MGRIEEHNMLAKIDRKREKQKQHEGSAPEELNDCSETMHAEDGTEMGKEGKARKKKKKKMKTLNKGDVVGNDFEYDTTQNEAVNVKDHAGVVKSSAPEELNACDETMDAEDGTEMGKEGKKKKKKKMKTMNKEDVVGNDFGYDPIQTVNVKDNVEVVKSSKKENGQKMRKLELKMDEKVFDKGSKKHRRVGGEATEVKEYSEVKFHDGREKKRSLQLDKEKDMGKNCELQFRKDKQRRHGENSDKDGTDSISSSMKITKQNKKGKDRTLMGQKLAEKEAIAEVKNGEGNRTKKIKKEKRDRESNDVEGKDSIVNAEDIGKVRDQSDGNIIEKVKHGKQEKKRKKRGREIEANIVGTEDDNKHKRKKVKFVENVSGRPEIKEVPTIEANIEMTDLSEKSRPNKTPKKVKFSGHVEVFPSSDGQEGLIQGKRFSPEENEMVKKAVLRYIEDHNLGEEGLMKILKCSSYPEVKGCWKEIASALPWRPHESIYYRAHVIFERDNVRTWTSEEKETIRRFHEHHGSDWRALADALGKHRFQVKDAWRRIRLPNRKKGIWAQEEYQTLFDLVNLDLRMRALEKKKSKHGMLRDNIGWEAICEKLSTRINSSCCLKWYGQLTSPMVIEGKWADTDDYRLVNALFILDACCMEDVDWDSLLDHRSGELCRKRWDQMIRYIGHYKDKSFAEQVELLAKRYCPDLLDAREAWDAKVPVD